MIRTQIQLTEGQSRALKELAASRGVSMAAVIREGVEAVVRMASAVPADELRRRARQAAGRFRSGRGDLARRHDEHLAEAYSK